MSNDPITLLWVMSTTSFIGFIIMAYRILQMHNEIQKLKDKEDPHTKWVKECQETVDFMNGKRKQ